MMTVTEFTSDGATQDISLIWSIITRKRFDILYRFPVQLTNQVAKTGAVSSSYSTIPTLQIYASVIIIEWKTEKQG
jgi:hypothetical protein